MSDRVMFRLAAVTFAESMTMVKQSAIKKTALIMAPSTSALAYPNVFLCQGLPEM